MSNGVLEYTLVIWKQKCAGILVNVCVMCIVNLLSTNIYFYIFKGLATLDAREIM